MSYPVKPWEMSSSNLNPAGSSVLSPSQLYVPNTDRLHSTAVPFPGSGGGGTAVTNASLRPPIPPRPNQTRPIYSAYNRGSMMPYSYSSPYSSYGYGGGGYNPYTSYGPGGYGGGFYGNRSYFGSGYEPGADPSFSQLAEESSASAFQSIESFVSAFGSISMMLESTFHALYSSFRAVVGVADHLGRVKQVFSALAIFRFFKWMFRRILYLIGVSKIKPETIESLWSEASNLQNPNIETTQEMFLRGESTKPSSWPILMFLGFIFAGPYLMWKLIKSLNLDGSQSVQSREWAAGESEHFVAEVTYPFDGVSDTELNLQPGQTIRLAPAKYQPNNVRGWALASNGSKIGLVPLNYIKVLGKRSGSSFKRFVNYNNFEGQSAEEVPSSDHSFAGMQPPTGRPRVRFDLNPRPPGQDSAGYKTEPNGILVNNNSNTSKSEDGNDPPPLESE